jgi:cytochrome c-type biogenesis protein
VNARSFPRAAIVGGIVVIAAIASAIAWGPIGLTFERSVGYWQNAIAAGLTGPAAVAGWRLYAVAFIGGLAASISPCILGMLPVNLSYIGAAKLTSRPAAVRVAGTFVLGVIAVNVALGFVSSLFFALFVQYRAPVNIVVGVLMVLMGLWLVGVVRLPVPQVVSAVPSGAGSFVVGVVFALVASPCASPILVVILGAVSLAGSPLRAVGAMTLYAIGYTLVLFLASVFAGIAAASHRMLAHAELISRIAATAMVIIGIATVVYGVSQALG